MKSKVIPVYQRDLHQDTVTYKVRLDTDELDHGDTLKLEIEKIDDIKE